MNEIAIIGTGYVGLTTGAVLAHLGHSVVCADVDAEKVAMLRRGEVPIVEAGLDELVREGIDGGRLSFVLGAANAVAGAEFIFLCVPTPQGQDGSADLSFIRSVAEEIGPHVDAEAIVINKSTVPVGSTRVVEQHLGRDDVVVVSNPEFLREGSAVHDCLHPDRIVIGSEDQAAAIKVGSLLEGVQAPLIVTAPASAETIKYASNAFLATKVSFVNAIANLCEAVGADVREVVLGMGYDKRIGFEFLKPGPGWGGSCLVGEETVLVRRGDDIRLRAIAELFEEVTEIGLVGYEALAWRPGAAAPEFLPISTVTARPYRGDVVTVHTKMGRRVTSTPDHPFVVGDGQRPGPVAVKLADELNPADWLPVAQGSPWVVPADSARADLLSTLEAADVGAGQVIVRLGEAERADVVDRLSVLPAARRRDVLRANTARLSELDLLGVPADDGRFGTVTNGTYVPASLVMDDGFWRLIGLHIAEGHVGSDGRRRRVAWSFHPTAETDLVEFVAGYWRSVGVKVDVRRVTTTMQVSVSSRILAGWIREMVGTSCYDKRIPDAIWGMPDGHKRALLRGLWDGDGSWSLVAGGPSVVFEYGTVSRALADGMLRLLGDLGIMARLRVGRSAKSTVDTYWLCVSGAEQLERSMWLFPEHERIDISSHVEAQHKRIAPTGYRRLDNHAGWVRVRRTERSHHDGLVYSLEVPAADTVVTTGGLVVHNCFPKDTRALVRIAEEAGYDFGLLKGVIQVNDEQFERVAEKIERLAGGALDGTTVAVWGLTFKARTGDLRDSPSLAVITRLRERGARVQAFDPTVEGDLDGIQVLRDPYAACQDAAVLAVLTEWDEFRWLDFGKVKDALAAPRIVDARNLLDAAAMKRRGFVYEGIGRV